MQRSSHAGPTLLIAGGYDKHSEYDEWIESFGGKVRYLVLIGQTRDKIAECARRHGFTEIMYAEDMPEVSGSVRHMPMPGRMCFCLRPAPAGECLTTMSSGETSLRNMYAACCKKEEGTVKKGCPLCRGGNFFGIRSICFLYFIY